MRYRRGSVELRKRDRRERVRTRGRRDRSTVGMRRGRGSEEVSPASSFLQGARERERGTHRRECVVPHGHGDRLCAVLARCPSPVDEDALGVLAPLLVAKEAVAQELLGRKDLVGRLLEQGERLDEAERGGDRVGRVSRRDLVERELAVGGEGGGGRHVGDAAKCGGQRCRWQQEGERKSER